MLRDFASDENIFFPIDCERFSSLLLFGISWRFPIAKTRTFQRLSSDFQCDDGKQASSRAVAK
jgi:hypothetical protein